MSMHWNPGDEIARWVEPEQPRVTPRQGWPEGATAGLLLVAACCLSVGLVLYKVAGPRDLVEDGAAWRKP